MIKQRNYVFLVVVLICAGILAWECYYREHQWHIETNICGLPHEIGGWSSQELPIKKSNISLLEADNAFIRRYTGPKGEQVYLNIAYSHTNRSIISPPEVFYAEENISILDKSKDSIILNAAGKQPEIKASRLVLENETVRQIAYYWFKIGDINTPSYWKHRFFVALDNLRGRRTGSAVICISSDIIEGNQQKAMEAIKDFAAVIIPQLSQYLP